MSRGTHFLPFIERVRGLMVRTLYSQNDKGIKKYGVALSEQRQGEQDWCDHTMQELVDAIQYTQMAAERIKFLERQVTELEQQVAKLRMK